jgi:hypothetical protein
MKERLKAASSHRYGFRKPLRKTIYHGLFITVCIEFKRHSHVAMSCLENPFMTALMGFKILFNQ